MEIREELSLLEQEAISQIRASMTLAKLEEARVAFLGKKGPITEVSKGMKNLSPEDRPLIGTKVNEVRTTITEAIEEQKAALEFERLNQQLLSEKVDVTLPGKIPSVGQRHI